MTADVREGIARTLAAHIFRPKYAGWRFLIRHGGRYWLHGFLRAIAPELYAMGFTVKPIANNGTIRALCVRKDRRSWWLIDIEGFTGIDGWQWHRLWRAIFDTRPMPDDEAQAVLEVIERWVAWVRDTFDVEPRTTFASTAIAIIKRWMPEEVAVRPCPPLVEVLCREGHAYRGGWYATQPGRHHGWSVDIASAYPSACDAMMPTEWRFMRCPAGDVPDGIWMGWIDGELPVPYPMPVWDGARLMNTHWQKGRVLTILTGLEWRALRRAGCNVDVRWGLRSNVLRDRHETQGEEERRVALQDPSRYLEWCWLSVPIQRFFDARRFAPSRPFAESTKRMAVAVYGRLAARRRVWITEYALERPGPRYYPALTPEGEEIPNAWTCEVERFAPWLQVGAAAMITARVRVWMLDAVMTVYRYGGTVPLIYTDMLVFTNRDALDAILPSRRPMWKLQSPERGEPVVIEGKRAWNVGERACRMGWSRPLLVPDINGHWQDEQLATVRLRSPDTGGGIRDVEFLEGTNDPMM
jgi:hypothetical protein